MAAIILIKLLCNSRTCLPACKFIYKNHYNLKIQGIQKYTPQVLVVSPTEFRNACVMSSGHTHGIATVACMYYIDHNFIANISESAIYPLSESAICPLFDCPILLKTHIFPTSHVSCHWVVIQILIKIHAKLNLRLIPDIVLILVI